MKFVSLFAGIGGFDLALERAGHECVAQIEIDPACRKVLSRHWPNVPRFEDVREVDGRGLGGPVELVVGGWPCQDLSVAGLRAGLAGERSGLFSEFIRIARECSARWILGENVPGLLSSNGGRDMGTVLGAVADLGMGHAYRVLDAQFFGLAQRRKRVFVVGHLGEPWSAPVAVLLEPESCDGDPPPRREARPGVAAPLASCAPGSSGYRNDADTAVNLVSASTGTARDVAPTVSGKWAKGRGGYAGQNETENCVMVPAQDPAYALSAAPASHQSHGEAQQNYVVAYAQQGTNVVTHALGCGATGGAVTEDGTGRGVPLVASTLVSPGRQWNSAQNLPNLVTAFAAQSGGDMRGITGALPGALPGALHSSQRIAMQRGATVRRLTPLECERLQGFPDGWTEGESDSARYRMLGNSVAVPVIEWIGKRMTVVDQGTRRIE